ncbi:deoxyribonuclease V [Flavobacterium selenitireducens]|uniref:deoxyribonuclease V n=1 Tax=Flavobacterium selenitireducens TaxID=2722704 RepID=UPI00168C0AB8|nr:deoxyribonuclease V [Flavobacterium selenitireducens]MBD3581028.1 endonuclease V [Flavobacterium selenitireducens]
MPLTYESLSISDATAIQKELKSKINLEPLESPVTLVAGADVSFNKFSTTVYAGIVVMDFPEMKLRQVALAKYETTFPYVSGYLAFREMPALEKAWTMLSLRPDVLILDGQGITHPRSVGIATHFGILEDQPTIGCAKSMLSGKFDELGLEKFSTSPIVIKEKLSGYALRTKNAVKPIYISPGHRVSVAQSLEIVTQCVGKYRIPEPTRIAHEQVNLFRTGQLGEGVYDF